eukprot:3743707-Amphidinium_carterae.1
MSASYPKLCRNESARRMDTTRDNMAISNNAQTGKTKHRSKTHPTIGTEPFCIVHPSDGESDAVGGKTGTPSQRIRNRTNKL